jgi:hypothetical protein
MANTVVLHAWTTAPSTKRMSANRMTFLRPKRSAKPDESGETMSARRAVDDVMMDLSIELSARCDSESPIETRVADMTPVSSTGWWGLG